MLRKLSFLVLCLTVFVTVNVSSQETRSEDDKQLVNKYGEIIFPGPTYRPEWAQTTTTTTETPEVRGEYVQPDDDDEECVLNATPPDPDSGCCGIDASTVDRIVGGVPVLIENHPWLVHIEYYDSTKNVFKKLCGGFLISGRYVMSAAHCFAGEVLNVAQPVNVILGEYDTTNEGPDCVKINSGATVCTDGAISVPIERYRVHPEFVSDATRIKNDVALIRLNRTVEFTKFIRPICLPTTDITASPSSPLRFLATGWGAVKDRILNKYFFQHQYELDGIKRHVDLPHVDQMTCADTFKFLTPMHICAGAEKGKDSCRGDSGGPLVYNDDGVNFAVGMVSTGLKQYVCGTEGKPAVYTRIVSIYGVQVYPQKIRGMCIKYLSTPRSPEPHGYGKPSVPIALYDHLDGGRYTTMLEACYLQ
ncbi:trypsin domain-containing protein [Phthorimaea operculella]|nr:trypsin domain-containing protein [Phthorimaea operculella]